jgi:hypothetical protein
MDTGIAEDEHTGSDILFSAGPADWMPWLQRNISNEEHRIRSRFEDILLDYAIVWRGKIGYDDALDAWIHGNGSGVCCRLSAGGERTALNRIVARG